MIITFHMGAHKTASSLIQHRLRRLCRRRYGRDLAFLDNKHVAQSPWGAWCVRGKGSQGAALESFKRQIETWQDASPKAVIISSEGFLGTINSFGPNGLYPEAPEILARFKELVDQTANIDIRPIYYIRRTDRFLESCLSQRLSLGRDAASENMFAPELIAAASWRPVIEAIETTLGEPVAVRNFEDLKIQGPARFVATFLAAAGMPAPTVAERLISIGQIVEFLPKPVQRWHTIADFLRPNAGLSARGSEIAGHIRPLVSPEEWHRIVRPFLRQHFIVAVDSARLGAPKSAAATLQQQYDADCAWIGERFRLPYTTAT